MIEIIKLNEDRWKDFRDIRLDALKKEPLAFSSSYNEEKNMPEEEWRRRIRNALFALSNDKPIGMIACVPDSKPKTKHIVNIFGVYVIREYRGQGIGKKLIGKALTQIQKNKGVVKVKLAINPEQKAAVGLYHKFGFKIVGRLHKELLVDGRFYDDLIMEKHL